MARPEKVSNHAAYIDARGGHRHSHRHGHLPMTRPEERSRRRPRVMSEVSKSAEPQLLRHPYITDWHNRERSDDPGRAATPPAQLCSRTAIYHTGQCSRNRPFTAIAPRLLSSQCDDLCCPRWHVGSLFDTPVYLPVQNRRRFSRLNHQCVYLFRPGSAFNI